jgi:hydroxyethylthiazole kinase-like uncharacterized protein yjeF
MISSDEMRDLEEKAQAKGISSLDLMEQAGKEVARVIKEKKEIKGKKILVVSYHGNNGGDGFVAARYLSDTAEVDVLFIGNEENLKDEARENFNKIEEDPLIQFISLDYVDFGEYDIIIDAILGTGVRDNLDPIMSTVIEQINNSEAFRVSIDIPTGMNPDTGEISNIAIKPDLIITLHELKKGLSKFEDKTVVVDIGLK